MPDAQGLLKCHVQQKKINKIKPSFMSDEPRIIWLSTVGSTNSYAASLIREGVVAEGTVVSALFQSEGRGQSKNRWESEYGRNLLLSIVLFPTAVRPEDQFSVSIAVSLGIKDTLTRYIDSVKIKWPNDIYAGNDKIAGILIESAISGETILHTIVGVGLNVNQEKFISDAPNPISMKMITGKEFDTAVVLEELRGCIEHRYKELIRGGREVMDGDYQRSLWRLGEWHRFRRGTSEFTGMITGTSRSGCLMVRDESGTIREFAFREIEYLR
jgi:BirA family transcriptional regulator, biotin operon repressor / biotin---[acetyl-CoA-carboxylase] ligase